MDGKEKPADVRTWTDQRLIQEYLQSRRKDLFEVLVRRHQDQVYSMCVRMLGKPAVAEEVAQDVFIAVYKNLDRFRGDAKFTTWLYRVVVNHCKNKQSYLIRRKTDRHDSMDQGKETEEGEMKRELPSPNIGPEKASLQLERHRILEAGLQQLSDDQRNIIVMRDLRGMPYDEIAEILEVAEGTVKSRLHRARAALKTKVGRVLASLGEARSEA